MCRLSGDQANDVTVTDRSVIARDVVGPHQMQEEYGLVGGNIFHGELSLEQLFHLRPAPGYADYRDRTGRFIPRIGRSRE